MLNAINSATFGDHPRVCKISSTPKGVRCRGCGWVRTMSGSNSGGVVRCGLPTIRQQLTSAKRLHYPTSYGPSLANSRKLQSGNSERRFGRNRVLPRTGVAIRPRSAIWQLRPLPFKWQDWVAPDGRISSYRWQDNSASGMPPVAASLHSVAAFHCNQQAPTLGHVLIVTVDS